MPVCRFVHARELQIRTDIVVLGYNSENADYDNPRGAFYGYAAYVVAEAPDGKRWAHSHQIRSMVERDAVADIETLRQRMQARLDAGGRFNPKHWCEIQAAYGSEAYQRDGWEQEAIYLEKREAADEWFTGH